jgi:PhoPQ-activated pathogenicity-related protein
MDRRGLFRETGALAGASKKHTGRPVADHGIYRPPTWKGARMVALKHFRTLAALLSLVLVLAAVSGCATAGAKAKGPVNNLRATADLTPLDEYVAKPDPNYAYSLVSTIKGNGYTGYVIQMTSQQWLTAELVDQPLWKHWVTIVRPDRVTSATALMMIDGGNSKADAPKGADPNLRRIALAANTIVASVKNIPNEPLVFSDDKKRRTEDGIIAYCWDKFLRTGDALWLTRLPMTKAVVRAMDTVQEFCASKEGGKVKVDDFVVAGASKRGWTTWTTAAVDRRVVAAVPIVIDLLNIVPSFKHHFEVYGQWAPAVGDYSGMGVMDWIGSAEFDALAKIVEPYSYRDRLTMPKLIMCGAGDQFFLNDSWKFYLADLKGPTYLRYGPNSGHGLESSDPVGTVTAFYKRFVDKKAMPNYGWTFPDENTIRVTSDEKPLVVKLWQATNPDKRDFRVDTLGHKYTATELQAQPDGSWTGKVDTPTKGWTAYLVELTYGTEGDQNNLVLSSPVRTVPDTVEHTFVPKADWPDGFLHRQGKTK